MIGACAFLSDPSWGPLTAAGYACGSRMCSTWAAVVSPSPSGFVGPLPTVPSPDRPTSVASRRRDLFSAFVAVRSRPMFDGRNLRSGPRRPENTAGSAFRRGRRPILLVARSDRRIVQVDVVRRGVFCVLLSVVDVEEPVSTRRVIGRCAPTTMTRTVTTTEPTTDPTTEPTTKPTTLTETSVWTCSSTLTRLLWKCGGRAAGCLARKDEICGVAFSCGSRATRHVRSCPATLRLFARDVDERHVTRSKIEGDMTR